MALKRLLVSAAGACTCAGPAFAQSMNISGLLDVGVRYASGPAKAWAMNRGNNNRLIFSGTEDLGDDLAATFALEMRFEPDTGTLESNNGLLFGGESRVGLRGKFGHIRLGRGLTAVQQPNVSYDPWVNTTVAALQPLLTAFYNSEDASVNTTGVGTAVPGQVSRWRNAVFYDSPSFGGLVGRMSVQAKEDNPGSRSYPISASLNYSDGPLSVLAGYEVNNLNTKYGQVAAAYTVGGVTLLGSFAINDPEGPARLTGYGGGARIPVWTATTIRIGYAATRSNLPGVTTAKRPDGTLVTSRMPIDVFRQISDNDLKALITYMRSIPAVNNPVPRTNSRLDPPPPPGGYGPRISVPDVPRTNKILYGRYLATVAHCTECHTPGEGAKKDYANRLGAGGAEFVRWQTGEVYNVSRNITPDPISGIGNWTDQEIKDAITKGIRKGGGMLRFPMAFSYYQNMKAEDVDAIVAYLRSLPPKKGFGAHE